MILLWRMLVVSNPTVIIKTIISFMFFPYFVFNARVDLSLDVICMWFRKVPEYTVAQLRSNFCKATLCKF